MQNAARRVWKTPQGPPVQLHSASSSLFHSLALALSLRVFFFRHFLRSVVIILIPSIYLLLSLLLNSARQMGSLPTLALILRRLFRPGSCVFAVLYYTQRTSECCSNDLLSTVGLSALCRCPVCPNLTIKFFASESVCLLLGEQSLP